MNKQQKIEKLLKLFITGGNNINGVTFDYEFIGDDDTKQTINLVPKIDLYDFIFNQSKDVLKTARYGFGSLNKKLFLSSLKIFVKSVKVNKYVIKNKNKALKKLKEVIPNIVNDVIKKFDDRILYDDVKIKTKRTAKISFSPKDSRGYFNPFTRGLITLDIKLRFPTELKVDSKDNRYEIKGQIDTILRNTLAGINTKTTLVPDKNLNSGENKNYHLVKNIRQKVQTELYDKYNIKPINWFFREYPDIIHVVDKINIDLGKVYPFSPDFDPEYKRFFSYNDKRVKADILNQINPTDEINGKKVVYNGYEINYRENWTKSKHFVNQFKKIMIPRCDDVVSKIDGIQSYDISPESGRFSSSIGRHADNYYTINDKGDSERNYYRFNYFVRFNVDYFYITFIITDSVDKQLIGDMIKKDLPIHQQRKIRISYDVQ